MRFQTYNEASELEADEKRDLFPPRFIIDVVCTNRSFILQGQCKISCYDKNKTLIFDDLIFNINVSARRTPEPGNYIVKSECMCS